MSQYQGAHAPEGQVAVAPPPAAAPSRAAFPKVNLLPPLITQEVKVRQAKLLLVGAAAVSVAVIGGMFVMAQNEVTSAQEGLDAANAQSAQLAAQQATYAEVPKVFAEVSAAQAQLATAMGNEVRWSYVLNNLALSIPRNVALTGFTGTLGQAEAPVVPPAPAPNADGSTTPAPETPAVPVGPVGTISYQGEATSYRAIASWLDSQAKQRTLDNVYLSSATRGDAKDEGPTVVTFDSTADLTPKSLSHRFDKTGN